VDNTRLECKICGKEFKVIHQLTGHLGNCHHIKIKEYYDSCLKRDFEGVCEVNGCDKKTRFINLRKGYSSICRSHAAIKGRKKESIEKFSISMKNLYKDPNSIFNSAEYKKKLSDGIKNSHKKKEVKDKMSIAAKQRWENKSFREKMSNIISEGWKNEKIRKNHTFSDETKKKLKKCSKERWRDSEYRDKMISLLKDTRRKFIRISKPQKTLYELVKQVFPQAELEYPIGVSFVDIAVPSHSLIFEYDGSYWHNLPGSKEKDKIRQERIELIGWSFIRYVDNIPLMSTLKTDIYKLFEGYIND
jgi:very-short-patch-repair endonuclease